MSQISLRSSGCQGKRSKDVHDQVDIDKLDWVERRLCHGNIADDHDDNDAEVRGNLELKEALHVHEDVAAPHDGAHARVEVVRLEHH